MGVPDRPIGPLELHGPPCRATTAGSAELQTKFERFAPTTTLEGRERPRGDPIASKHLTSSTAKRVYRLAYRLAGDDGLAREFTQDTFVRAFERLASFRGEAKLSTWLHAIATSVVLNGLRKVKRFRRRETDLEDAAGVAGGRRAAEPDLKRRLAQAIDDLPHGYRTVFVMHDVEGYTHEEIGATLGVETGTSKAQLSRARARLREALADFAGEWVS